MLRTGLRNKARLQDRQATPGLSAAVPACADQLLTEPYPSRRERVARLDRFDRAAFSAHTGSGFTFLTPGGLIPLKLVEVQDRRRKDLNPGSSGECFALRLQGPAGAALEQETYHVEHDHLGSFDLFIVPGGATPQARYYEALFNRTTG